MTREMPWDDIGTPDRDYNVRRARESGSIPLYWGKDVEGHCLFLVELGGDHEPQFRRETTTVRGIRVDLRQSDVPEQQRLVLTLEEHIDQDLFLGLCETLADNLGAVTDYATALAVSLSGLKRWKAFLAGRRSRLLSPEEIRGLFAELQFLRTLYKDALKEREAIEAWCGADGIHQDFLYHDLAIEVKSISGKDRSTVRISSEDQLETTLPRLFLMTYRLAELPHSQHALSLNDLVSEIQSELSDTDARDGFEARLVSYGYAPLSDYDVPRLVVSGMQAYSVTSEFPRLVRSTLPNGVARVSYEIELEKLEPFACDAALMTTRL